MNPERLQQLSDVYRSALLDDILPFWTRHSVDKEAGGFLTCLDRDGSIVDTDKGVWQQGRATWLFGELYNSFEQREQWLQLALHGAEFLERHCFDDSDGRMWFQVDRSGRPLRKRRYSYSESFAAIAFGELAQATGKEEYAVKARRCFSQFIDQNLNPDPRDAKFTNVRPTRGIGFPMITINTAQELRRSIALPDADDWIDRSIDSIAKYHVHEDVQCVLENVGPNGEVIEHFDGRTLNPGHAIEGAWFIMEEGRLRQDAELMSLGKKMLRWMWRRGWDDQYGGLLYFVDLHGGSVQEYWHDMKFWWPHNEAVIATLLAWSLDGETEYGDWHAAVHDWSFKHFPDPEQGEWFGYLHRDGRLSSQLKGNLWKGPFHLPRMLLACLQVLARVDGGASKAC